MSRFMMSRDEHIEKRAPDAAACSPLCRATIASRRAFLASRHQPAFTSRHAFITPRQQLAAARLNI